jgi:hypothetical protein
MNERYFGNSTPQDLRATASQTNHYRKTPNNHRASSNPRSHPPYTTSLTPPSCETSLKPHYLQQMDQRRPIRPTSTARRGLFHNTTSRRHPHPNPLHTASSLHPSHTTSTNPNARPPIPLAAAEADPAEDLVERDSAGNYKISAPITAMKMGSGGTGGEDEEVEQENQMIALYGKENCHWDQAGEFACDFGDGRGNADKTNAGQLYRRRLRWHYTRVLRGRCRVWMLIGGCLRGMGGGSDEET